VPEEVLVALAQVMKSRIPVRGGVKRSFGQPPWHANRTSHCRQYAGSASRLALPNALLLRRGMSSSRVRFPDVPQEIGHGSTKWSHEYRSPLCSRATAVPQVSLCTHSEPGTLAEARQVESNICTKHRADVVANPLLEHLMRKASLPGRGHTSARSLVAGRIPRARAVPRWDELHEVGAQVVGGRNR